MKSLDTKHASHFSRNMIVINDIAHKSLSTIILENSNTQMNSVYHSLIDSADKKLYRIVLYWIGLDWIVWYWIGLYGIGLDWIGLDWTVLYWIGLQWIGLQWIGLQWIGLDWIGLDCMTIPIPDFNRNFSLFFLGR